MARTLDQIDLSIKCSKPVYVHCWSDRVRTGPWSRYSGAASNTALCAIDSSLSLCALKWIKNRSLTFIYRNRLEGVGTNGSSSLCRQSFMPSYDRFYRTFPIGIQSIYTP
jgi:hypothetical protein